MYNLGSTELKTKVNGVHRLVCATAVYYIAIIDFLYTNILYISLPKYPDSKPNFSSAFPCNLCTTRLNRKEPPIPRTETQTFTINIIIRISIYPEFIWVALSPFNPDTIDVIIRNSQESEIDLNTANRQLMRK